jgi:ATP-dependent DNA helicase RecG
MQLVEQVGSGIIRMNDLMKEVGLPAPESTTEGMFTITLRRPPKVLDKKEEPSKKTVEKTVEKTIIDLIKNNPKSTTKNMMIATGLSRRGVEYQLNKLKASGEIERIGPDKGGYWKITK